MKIRVILPTLRSGGKFAAVLEQMRDFASGKHEISWNVVCNDDDTYTLARMPSWVTCWAGSSMVPYMQRCNQAAMAGEFDWLMQWVDDMYSLACWWDEYIADQDPEKTPLVSWQSSDEPNGLSAAVMTPRYMRALGQPFTAWFPYWFTDAWNDEVHRLAFGAPVPLIEGLEAFGPPRGKTRLMRDLGFWVRFYAATRPERLLQARRVMAEFGRQREIPLEQMDAFAEYDRQLAAQVAELEAAYQPSDEPMPPHYPVMRAAAEQYLQRTQP